MEREDIDAQISHAIMVCKAQGAGKQDIENALAGALYRLKSQDYKKR